MCLRLLHTSKHKKLSKDEFHPNWNRKKGDWKPLIAKEDIIVYKILHKNNGKLISPFQGFQYERGFEYYEKEPIKIHSFLVTFDYITTGLHSFVTKKAANDSLKSPFHFRNNKIIVKMIIPKGSKYYIGDFDGNFDSIVSNRLIFPHK